MCKSRPRKPARLPKIRQRYQNDTKNRSRTAYFSSPGRPGPVARFRPATGHPPRLLLRTNRTINMITNKVIISFTPFYGKNLSFPFPSDGACSSFLPSLRPAAPANAERAGTKGSVRQTENDRTAVFGKRGNGFFRADAPATLSDTGPFFRTRPPGRKRSPAAPNGKRVSRQVADTLPQTRSDAPDVLPPNRNRRPDRPEGRHPVRHVRPLPIG